MLLPSNPPHVLMPSEVELTDAGVRFGSWDPSQCVTCTGSGSFNMVKEGTADEIEHIECDCVEQMVLNRWLTVRGVPMPMQRLRWNHMIPGAIPQDVFEYVTAFPQMRAMGRGLVLFGPSGSGKTALAFLTLKRVLEANLAECYAVHGSGFMERVNGWNDTEKRERFMQRVSSVPLLVYDSLGHEVAAGYADKPRPDEVKSAFAIERLLRQRNASGLSTIITTNLDSSGVRQMFGSETWSLLSDSCLWVNTRTDENAHRVAAATAEWEFRNGVRRPVVLH